ncbi:MAG: phage holin family protein [Bacilli bacterium]|nr:phage holin family protein [Bacilli bacterium]
MKKENKLLEWLIHMIGYSLILITITTIFKNTLYIDNSYYGLWSLIASIIIYILNKTIKPLIVSLTIPITALTLGLFYPFINVLILNIVSLILGKHFNIPGGLFMSFIIAVIISLMNLIMNKIINKIIEGVKK